MTNLVATKGITRTVQKYAARVGVAGADYVAGVTNPKTPWSQGAAAADAAWKAGTQEAISRGAFASGVAKAGDAKWSSASKTLGPARFGPGVEFGKPYYQSGMTSVLGTIEGVSLPTKGPAGADQNYARSKAVGDALHAAKIAAKG